jgi:hypothetical protein
MHALRQPTPVGELSRGDVLLCEVLELGEDDTIEVVDSEWHAGSRELAPVPAMLRAPAFSRRPLSIGDFVLGAVGGRYATDYFEAVVPTGSENQLDLVTFGGVFGIVRSQRTGLKAPTRVRPLAGFVDHDGIPINTGSFVIPSLTDESPCKPIILVAGTSMESGKTTLAAAAIRALTVRGLRVNACKLTGCATFRDPMTMSVAGAVAVSDFGAFGHPSTQGLSEGELLQLFERARAVLSQKTPNDRVPDVIIFELADGIMQPETQMLLRSDAVKRSVRALLFAAPDPIGAYGGTSLLRQWGWTYVVVGGRVGSSSLSVRELRELVGDQVDIVDSHDRTSAAPIWDKLIDLVG